MSEREDGGWLYHSVNVLNPTELHAWNGQDGKFCVMQILPQLNIHINVSIVPQVDTDLKFELGALWV